MDMKNLPRARQCALLLAALVCPLASAATTSTIQTNSGRIFSNALGLADDIQVGLFQPAATAEITRDTVATVNGTLFTETGFASAEPAALRASSSISAIAGPLAANYFHQVTAVTTDGFRVDSAAYDGLTARVEYALDISGTLAPTIVADGFPPATAVAHWSVDSGCSNLALCTQTRYEGKTQAFAGGILVPTGHTPGLLNFALDLQLGSEFQITTILEVITQLTFTVGAEGAFGSATADFSNTVVWGGIQSVMLGDGTLVTDWTTVSGSGFDYGSATVVPVPAALWLFASALLGLVGVRRCSRY